MSSTNNPEISSVPSSTVRGRRSKPPRPPKRPPAVGERQDKGESKTPSVRNSTQSFLVALVLSAMSLLLVGYFLGLFHTKSWAESANLHAVDSSEQHDAMESINATGKPFVIAFYTTSCMACRRMRKTYERASKLLLDEAPCFAAELSQPINKRWIDVFQLRAVPAVYFVRGAHRAQYKGDRDAEKLVEFVKSELKQTQMDLPK